jgi:hypothetical protein
MSNVWITHTQNTEEDWINIALRISTTKKALETRNINKETKEAIHVKERAHNKYLHMKNVDHIYERKSNS